MFGPVQPTPYDLTFSLFGIPVRVIAWFWLTAVILGFSSVHIGPEYLLAWVAIVFVSILVHELGHALVAAAFGYPPRILLYHFGDSPCTPRLQLHTVPINPHLSRRSGSRIPASGTDFLPRSIRSA
ncbi:MAG: hypothetical protein R3B91_16710 [Planctomycetaceae bacterium]